MHINSKQPLYNPFIYKYIYEVYVELNVDGIVCTAMDRKRNRGNNTFIDADVCKMNELCWYTAYRLAFKAENQTFIQSCTFSFDGLKFKSKLFDFLCLVVVFFVVAR